MQEPIGFSGVQMVPKSLQSVGFFTPRRMSGHSHPFTSCPLGGATEKRTSLSNSASSSRISRALAGIVPRPRHSNSARRVNTEVTSACAFWFPSRVTTRVYSFSTSARPALSWRTSIRTDCMTSSGSKPEITTGRR